MSAPRMWDDRYRHATFAYGKNPNDFLVSVADRLPPGRVLCIGEGEGRNATYLASLGHDVTAVDFSHVGLRKAERLADERGVRLSTRLADLRDFDIGREQWSAIISIFCHLEADLRVRVHRDAVAGLSPDGAFVLEAYTPEQLACGTGGPPRADLMMTLDGLRHELEGLDLAIARESKRIVKEGQFHDGPSAVVQVLGFKPPRPSVGHGV